MTKGQQFAKDMRKNLGIGTRTRRWGSRIFKGSDMHRMILDCIAEATHYNGMYSEGRQELFRAAFPALCSYEKHILGGRADAVLVAHLNGLSPWQLCNVLADMIDAGISNVGQGERFFAEMARSLQALTSAEEGNAPGQPEAAETTPKSQAATRIPTGSMSRTLRRTRRNTLRTAVTTSRALSYRTLSGIIAAHVEAGRLVKTGDFLDRIGGGDLKDGEKSWFGRHVAKAYRATHGGDPVRVWTQHRTTGKFIHVLVYGAIDPALYAGLRSYKATQHLLADMYARCA